MSEAVVTGAMQQLRRLRVVTQLQHEAAALEAVGALRTAGIRSIVLKGPSIARWLYDDPWMRSYGDIDLLVAPEDRGGAAQTLTRLGYVDHDAGLADDEYPGHAHHWSRSGVRPAEIDLHHRLFWFRGRAREAWDELSAGTEQLDLGADRVEVLRLAGRLMLVALHAAQHGRRTRQPIRDLELALERVGEVDWREAAALAVTLGLGEAFSSGIRLLPPGLALADRLALQRVSSIEMRVHAETMRPTVEGLRFMLEQRSWRSRAIRLWHELLPHPAFMRVRHPVARRGQRGMTAAYLWRPLWLAWTTPRAAAQLMRARRETLGGRARDAEV
jgi:hypothetical protein